MATIDEAIEALKQAFRDFNTDGVSSTGEYEPEKPQIRAGLDELSAAIDLALSAVGSGILRYATVALMNADTNEADGQLAYVYDNNGSPSDPANGVYQWDDGGAAWVVADWYFDSVAAVVQPLVDDAEAAAAAADADRIAASNSAAAAAASAAAASATVADVTANAKRARSWRSGVATVNLNGTIDASIGYSWIEGNSGNPEGSIAAIVAGAAIGSGQGYVVDMLAGPVDGSGRRIPALVTIASGAQTGWQTAGKHILIAKDGLNQYFGEYTRVLKTSVASKQVTSTLSGGGVSSSVKSPLLEDGEFVNFQMNNPINLTGAAVGAIQPWCDVWHLDRIWFYTGGASTVPFTDVGEQEIVLILSTGAFIGGSAHGYQKKSLLRILTPGDKQTADGTATGDRINFLQVSDFLNPATAGVGGYPNNAGDKLFRCNQEWVFEPGGRLTQRGYYECLVGGVITNADYVGMLKPCLVEAAVNIMTRVYLEGDWAEIDLTGAVSSADYKGKKLRYVAPASGLYMEATAVGSWTDGPDWKILLEGSGPKGKSYFMPHGAVPKTWALGERQYFEIQYLFGAL